MVNNSICSMDKKIFIFKIFSGPTIVYFHVTVMGLDSIDETSMVLHSTK